MWEQSRLLLEGSGLLCVRHGQCLSAKPGLGFSGCPLSCWCGHDCSGGNEQSEQNGEKPGIVSVFIHVEEGMADDHRSLD